jgi:hypothetical protein
VSYAAEHPVACCRSIDLGCKQEHPGGKWGAIKANEAGWFHDKAGVGFCPEHVPGWVGPWRAKQAEKKFEVKGSYTRLPAVLACSGCDLAEAEENESPEALKALKATAYNHGRVTGHAVSVTTGQLFTVEPA